MISEKSQFFQVSKNRDYIYNSEEYDVKTDYMAKYQFIDLYDLKNPYQFNYRFLIDGEK